MSTPDQTQLEHILQSAILAPSADNRHPIRFEIATDGSLNIQLTESQLPYAWSYKRILSLLSIGAMAENISVAANYHKLHAQHILFPSPESPSTIVQTTWSDTSTLSDIAEQTIAQRHTNRQLLFHGPKLSVQQQNSLSNQANRFSECKLTWLESKNDKQQALHLIRKAEAERFRNKILHQELFEAIRFDLDWHTSCEEGLPPGALCIETALRPAFKLLRHWPFMKILNTFGMYHLLGLRAAYIPCRLAPHLVALSVTELNDQAIFNAGRTFQNIWLRLTQLGYVIQPMPASTLYALDDAPKDGIPEQLQQHLKQGWRNILQEEIPVMVFRVGTASPSALHTQRRELGDYLLKKEK